MKNRYHSLEDYLEEIENFSARRERIPAEAMPFIEAVWEIQQEKIELYRRVVKHLLPELNGEFFICGYGGERINNLPTQIDVCPAYGADWSMVYERRGIIKNPEVLGVINEDK